MTPLHTPLHHSSRPVVSALCTLAPMQGSSSPSTSSRSCALHMRGFADAAQNVNGLAGQELIAVSLRRSGSLGTGRASPMTSIGRGPAEGACLGTPTTGLGAANSQPGSSSRRHRPWTLGTHRSPHPTLSPSVISAIMRQPVYKQGPRRRAPAPTRTTSPAKTPSLHRPRALVPYTTAHDRYGCGCGFPLWVAHALSCARRYTACHKYYALPRCVKASRGHSGSLRGGGDTHAHGA
ncbi:uncharacterized protein C8Q71DRAFT_744303 [Rhodofomes roseus]|uniref:Uncharacterized protein n=1 Tax=Rhodofomes roseus TaxID=34475 RepID=A0ABQ8KNT8_9APHY|nr:uncharacterized protein C8Q71DRAFT_744303 [Rhodofomes roseus]KAH9839815.1 hypothetical protein C8Q71DRAFT_744303 [Rhodofomes roseus]